MSDIFISYAHEDRPRAQTIAQTLEDHGWSTFWDRTIPTGKTWRETIGRELADAHCVIVLWSKASIESDWVQEEADDAKRRRVLVPILIESVQPPIGFRSIQAGDLSDWDGTESTQAFRRLITDITALIGSPAKEAEGRHAEAEVERQTVRRNDAEAKLRAEEEERRQLQPLKRRVTWLPSTRTVMGSLIGATIIGAIGVWVVFIAPERTSAPPPTSVPSAPAAVTPAPADVIKNPSATVNPTAIPNSASSQSPAAPIPPWLNTMREITGTQWSPGDPRPSNIHDWMGFIAGKYPETAAYLAPLIENDSYFSWAGLTVAYCMARAGIKPVFGKTDQDRFLWNSAWVSFGTRVDTPQPGDVLVFSFGPDDRHVGLFEGLTKDGGYISRGGNQSHKVGVAIFPRSNVMAIRRPQP